MLINLTFEGFKFKVFLTKNLNCKGDNFFQIDLDELNRFIFFLLNLLSCITSHKN